MNAPGVAVADNGQDAKLVRAIGLGSAILFVVGSVIGSGIFLTTGGMAAVIPSASLLLLAWTLGGVLAITGGLTYAEMGAMFPRSGGVYVFLREAYGPLPAFLYGWVAMLVVLSGGIAAVAVGFAEYLSYFVPAISQAGVLLSVPTPFGPFVLTASKLAAVGAIVALGAINYVGVRSGNLVNVVMTAAKVAGLAALPVMAIIAARVVPEFTPVVPPDLPRPVASFGIAMIAVLWTYEAWYFVTYAAGEIKDPQRNVPRALVGGIAALTTIYLVVNVAYLFALSIDEMKGVTRIAERAATTLAGPGGAQFVALTVVLSTFGCNAAAILAGSRLLFAMASDGVFLPAARSVHPRYRTPHVAIVALDDVVGAAGAVGDLRAAVYLRHVHLDSLQRRLRPRAVPAPLEDAQSSQALPNVGLSGRAYRVRDGLRRVRAQHARRAAVRITCRARVSRARSSRVLVLAAAVGFCVMKIAVLGSGAVGGYYGAKLARAGHDVTFIARGAHLAAIRARGLEIRSPVLGDFTVRAPAEEDTTRVGPVDVVLYAVKTYDNASALPMLTPMIGEQTSVLTVQNGVDSVTEVAAVAGERPVIGGTTYIATALSGPGLIEQTGAHRRIVFGEVFGQLPRMSERVRQIHDALAGADIQAEAVEDGRVPIWEKFIFLVSLAGFTGGTRLPIGPVWADPFIRTQFLEACREVERVARAEGVPVAPDVIERIKAYVDAIPGTMRSSLLIDLSQGKRIEVEALHGAVVRRAAKAGVQAPIMSALYAVLKPWASPPAPSAA